MIVEHGADVGLYAVKFFVNGFWVTVVVDDYLPCKFEGNQWQPIFARSMDQQHADYPGIDCLWVPLVEKAWAKLHGSYEAIALGSTEDALNYLTGGYTFSSELCANADDSEYSLLLQRIPLNSDDDEMTFCTCSLRQDVSYRTDLLSKCSDAVPGMVFSVTGAMLSHEGHRLIRIKNEGGNFEWKGPFCDNDPQWTTSLLAQAGRTVLPEPGCFWMCWADFTQYFAGLGFCNPWKTSFTADSGPLICKSITVHGSWRAQENAGGRLGLDTFRFNPRFQFKSNTAIAYLSIFQRDARCSFRQQWLDLYIYLIDPQNGSNAFPIEAAKLVGRHGYMQVQVDPGNS